jgi:hypothetical protein
MRERRLVGSTFPCPACHEPLVLMGLEADGPILQRVSALSSTEGAKPREDMPSARQSLALSLPTITSPLVVTWGLSGLVAVVIVALLWREQQLRPSPVVQQFVDHDAEPAVSARDAVEPPAESDVAAEAAQPIIAASAPADTPPAADGAAPPESPAEGTVLDEPYEPPVSALAVVAAPPPLPLRRDHRVLLSQRLVSFQQVQPVSRRALLQTIEDLLDRPVQVDDDVPREVAARLDATVTIALENATVEELLQSILKDTGIEYTCTADAVLLQRAQP